MEEWFAEFQLREKLHLSTLDMETMDWEKLCFFTGMLSQINKDEQDAIDKMNKGK